MAVPLEATVVEQLGIKRSTDKVFGHVHLTMFHSMIWTS